MTAPDRFSDLRVLRWFGRIDEILSGENLGPIRASLDLTNLCNHSCSWCEPLSFREQTINDKRHTLSTAIALRTLFELHELDCKTINFSGGGEPLLHREFGAILRCAVNLQFRTWVVTNGSLIDQWMDDLLLADHIRVSLDASNYKEHEQMHGKSGRGSSLTQFLEVTEGIKELCKRRVTRSPEVGLAYIIADCNSSSDSLNRVLDFAVSAGVDFVHFRPLSEETPQRFTEPWEQVVLRIGQIAPRFSGMVNIFPLGKRHKDVFQQREFEYCYASLVTAVISANGEVCACCDRRDIVFGNVNERSFKSIWLSAKHREMADAIVPKLCTRCLQCSFNRSVERFIVNNEALPELV